MSPLHPRVLLYVVLSIVTSCWCTAQVKETYLAEDGKKVIITIHNLDPDILPRSQVFLAGLLGPDGFYGGGLSHYIPTKFYGQVLTSFDRTIGGDFNILFGSRLRTKRIQNSLARSWDIQYTFQKIIPKRKSLGIHFGAFTRNQPEFSEGLDYSEKGAFLGLTSLRAYSVDFGISDQYKRRKASSLARINIDAIYYFDQEAYDDSLIVNTDNLRSFGARLSLDGYFGFWQQKGRLSLRYQFGLFIPSDQDEFLDLLVGFGIGYGFH